MLKLFRGRDKTSETSLRMRPLAYIAKQTLSCSTLNVKAFSRSRQVEHQATLRMRPQHINFSQP